MIRRFWKWVTGKARREREMRELAFLMFVMEHPELEMSDVIKAAERAWSKKPTLT